MTPDDLLRAYCAAFGARDAKAVHSLFAPNGLYELPLIGQRLVGSAEVYAGLRRAFALLETAAIEITAVKSTAALAIGEGTLRAKLHRDRAGVEMPFAIVLESSAGRIDRLSTHLDARPCRLWVDGPIFAIAG